MTEARSRTCLVLTWLAAAIVLGGFHLAASLDRRPLDDSDLAFQRPGFLDSLGPPFPAAPVAPGLPAQGERLLLFFIREGQVVPLWTSLGERAHPFDAARVAIVVAGPPHSDAEGAVIWISDPAGKIAAAYQMPRPRDRGAPVGYAIVDNLGQVRYRTLDPTVWKRLDEVWTMWNATP